MPVDSPITVSRTIRNGGTDPDGSKHVFGRCRHGESRHEATQDGVGPTLCKAIRHEYRTRGIESVASVIDRLNTPKVTFYHHLKGKCSHDHDVEPVYPND